jgi:hypothetical protein
MIWIMGEGEESWFVGDVSGHGFVEVIF